MNSVILYCMYYLYLNFNDDIFLFIIFLRGEISFFNWWMFYFEVV